MTPRNSEVFGNHIIRHILFTGLSHQITRIERTTELITFVVIGLGREAPRTFRENFSQHLQVHIIIDGKVVPTVTQIETTIHFITESRHNETGRITAIKRKETKRNGYRQWNILYHQLSRAEYDILLGANFCHG